MKPNFKFALIFTLFALLTFNACQQEAVEITQNQDEVFEPTSNVASLVRSTASNDVSSDNIMDGTDCFSVNLPVTIIANGITITIDSLEDLELLEEIFEEFNDDEDILEFLFPITIILNDYTEIVIENEDQLEDFIEECVEEEVDIIDCIDFVYPISFSIFNTEFDFIETVTINSDAELYEFLESLENEQGIIASLNYPVSMVYEDGTVIEVNSNQELEAALNAAEELCDDEEEDECDVEDIFESLVECPWAVAAFNNDNNFDGYQLKFFEDGLLKIFSNPNSPYIEGAWELGEDDEGHVKLIISNLTDLEEDFSGVWYFEDCEDDDRYELVRETDTGTAFTLVIEQDCDDDIDCSAQEIYVNLSECLWYSGDNTGANYNGPFNFDLNGTVTAEWENQVVTGEWEVELTDEGVLLILVFPEPYATLSGEWLIIECDDDRIKGVSGDHYVVFEQDCSDTGNPFDCFDDVTLALCDDDTPDGITQFDLEQAFADCNNDDVEVRFYATIGDAETDVNQLPSLYTNVTNPQTVYAKVTLAGTTESELFEIELIVEDCSQGSCTEEELDAILMECHWKATNINGSNDFADFDIYFNDGQELIIEGNGTTLDGNWITTGNPNEGVYLVISELDGNFMVFNDEWLVVECTDDFLHLQNGNDNLVLERVCD